MAAAAAAAAAAAPAGAVVGREAELAQLQALAGGAVGLPCVFVYGAPATGKTFTMQAVTREAARAGARVAWANCAELVSLRLLWEHLLNQLAGRVPSPSVT